MEKKLNLNPKTKFFADLIIATLDKGYSHGSKIGWTGHLPRGLQNSQKKMEKKLKLNPKIKFFEDLIIATMDKGYSHGSKIGEQLIQLLQPGKGSLLAQSNII